MTDAELNKIKSVIYDVLSKVGSDPSISLFSNGGTNDAFWKTVKIKELPVKESIDR